MTHFANLTDDFETDIDELDPFRPEQPPTRHRHTLNELCDWANGLDDDASGSQHIKSLRKANWSLNMVLIRLRDVGVYQEQDDAFMEVVSCAAALKRASDKFLSIKGPDA
jgi:hypothetical protein